MNTIVKEFELDMLEGMISQIEVIKQEEKDNYRVTGRKNNRNSIRARGYFASQFDSISDSTLQVITSKLHYDLEEISLMEALCLREEFPQVFVGEVVFTLLSSGKCGRGPRLRIEKILNGEENSFRNYETNVLRNFTDRYTIRKIETFVKEYWRGL